MARDNRNATNPIRVPRTRSQRERQRQINMRQKINLTEIFTRRYFGRFPLWSLCAAVVLLAAVVVIVIILPWQFIAMTLGILSILVLAAYYIYMQRN